MLGKVAQAAHLTDKGQDIEVESGREFVDLPPRLGVGPTPRPGPWLPPAPLLASSATATPAARPPRNHTDQTSAQSGLM